MQLELEFTPSLVEFTPEEQRSWLSGDRAGCLDDYCSRYHGNYGFGESRVGQLWDQRGHGWIHHDFSVFGGNRLGTFPKADAVLREILGSERANDLRRVYSLLKPFGEPGHGPFEEPDLLVYQRTTKLIRFAECKRAGTSDRLNARQGVGMWLLEQLLHCPVEYCLVAPRGSNPSMEPARFTYEWPENPLDVLKSAGVAF